MVIHEVIRSKPTLQYHTVCVIVSKANSTPALTIAIINTHYQSIPAQK
jgi:hypothetical protein